MVFFIFLLVRGWRKLVDSYCAVLRQNVFGGCLYMCYCNSIYIYIFVRIIAAVHVVGVPLVKSAIVITYFVVSVFPPNAPDIA